MATPARTDRPTPEAAPGSPHPPHPSLAALLAAYRPRTEAEAADLDRTRQVVAAGDPWSRALPLHVTASALVVHPPSRRVLLRWHARQRAWLQIGGHGDPGEHDPVEVVLREGQEETGLDDLVCWPDATLRQVTVVPVRANATEPAHEHADLRFVLATAAPERARPETPDAPLRWLSLPEAYALVAEPGLHDFFARVEELLDAAADPVDADPVKRAG